MNKKEKYLEAEISIVQIKSGDVISTSGAIGEDGMDTEGWA